MIKPCLEKTLVRGVGLGLKAVHSVVIVWNQTVIFFCIAFPLSTSGNFSLLILTVYWFLTFQMFLLCSLFPNMMFLANVGISWCLPSLEILEII